MHPRPQPFVPPPRVCKWTSVSSFQEVSRVTWLAWAKVVPAHLRSWLGRVGCPGTQPQPNSNVWRDLHSPICHACIHLLAQPLCLKLILTALLVCCCCIALCVRCPDGGQLRPVSSFQEVSRVTRLRPAWAKVVPGHLRSWLVRVGCPGTEPQPNSNVWRGLALPYLSCLCCWHNKLMLTALLVCCCIAVCVRFPGGGQLRPVSSFQEVSRVTIRQGAS